VVATAAQSGHEFEKNEPGGDSRKAKGSVATKRAGGVSGEISRRSLEPSLTQPSRGGGYNSRYEKKNNRTGHAHLRSQFYGSRCYFCTTTCIARDEQGCGTRTGVEQYDRRLLKKNLEGHIAFFGRSVGRHWSEGNRKGVGAGMCLLKENVPIRSWRGKEGSAF